MKKVLVTDLFGTLIPDDRKSELLYYYGNGNELEVTDVSFLNKVFEKGLISLKRFLKDGNEVYLVTDISTHDKPSVILSMIINRFFSNLEEYKENIHIFLSGSLNLYKEDLKSVSIQKDSDCYIFNDFEFYRIENKEDVFDYVLKEHMLYQELLFVIGNSEKDMPMLVKGIELGGRSSLINNFLYRYDDDLDLDNLIISIVRRNNHISYLELDSMNEEERLQYKIKMEQELGKMYVKLRSGLLDYDKLLKLCRIHDVLDNYNMYAMTCLPKKKQIGEEKIKQLTMYPTFIDYSRKNLNN